MSTQQNSDGCQFDEGEVVCGEFVVRGRNTPRLLDPVEEALDQIAGLVHAYLEVRNVEPAAPRETG